MIRALKKLARRIIDKGKGMRAQYRENKLERNAGYCNICEAETEFIIYDAWLRDNYKCKRCGTIPRNRALLNALNKFSPDWRKLQVHESSPGGQFSDFVKKHCPGYSSSHYFLDVPRGEYKGEHRSEDLTQLTFADEQFDVLLSSDVFEHVFEPEKAFAEINRVLKPGGVHIFTIPWVPANKKSVQRARLNADGSIEYLLPAEYHRNPVDKNGSLVTYDWGQDFGDIIYRHSGMTTTIYLEIDRGKGLDAKFLEVFISRKPYA